MGTMNRAYTSPLVANATSRAWIAWALDQESALKICNARIEASQ